VLERAYTSWVAFDAGNLLPVAKILRALYPEVAVPVPRRRRRVPRGELNKRLRQEYGVEELYKVLDGERTMQSKLRADRRCARMHEDTQRHAAPHRRHSPRGASAAHVRDHERRAHEGMGSGRGVGNAWVVWPKFAGRELEDRAGHARLTDFNDLHVVEGADKVAEQLGEAVKAIEDAHALAKQLQAGASAGRRRRLRRRRGGAATTSRTGSCTAR
jgi:hypothetical protein